VVVKYRSTQHIVKHPNRSYYWKLAIQVEIGHYAGIFRKSAEYRWWERREALNCSGARAECCGVGLSSLGLYDATRAATTTWGGEARVVGRLELVLRLWICKAQKFGSYPLIQTGLARTLQTRLLLTLISKDKAAPRSEALAGFPPKRDGRNLGVNLNMGCHRYPQAVMLSYRRLITHRGEGMMNGVCMIKACLLHYTHTTWEATEPCAER
jgi:hypothetical protein